MTNKVLTKPLQFMKAVDCDLGAVKFPGLATPKVDGVAGAYLGEGLTARTGRPFTNSFITETFSHPALRGICGEFTVGSLTDGGTCRRTTSLLNSLRGNRPSELPVWNAFDYVTEQTWWMKAKDRYELLQIQITKLPPELRSLVVPLPFMRFCNNLEEVLEFHEEVTGLGYEGTMLKWVNAAHKSGRSTIKEGANLRIKDMATSEAVVLELIEAEENLNVATLDHLGYSKRSTHQENKVGKGMLGSFRCLWEGREITVGAGELTHDERRGIWETASWIGRTITFKYMPYGTMNLPRFPRFVAERKGDQ
jgi:DNA ligase-1